MKLKDKIKQFPKRAGVYLFKSGNKEILYVGKAKSLSSRIAGYFKKGGKNKEAKIDFLLRKAADVEFIITDNEKEALLLENTLIKKHKPRYNIQLKDDKTYVSIRIGMEQVFPGISIVRKILKDGALYFGPYSSAASARSTLDQVIKAFKLRSCKDREFSNRVRPCLEFDLSRCSAPCVNKISKSDYKEHVEDTILFLKRSSKELLQKLNRKMKDLSASMKYEDAAKIRDVVSQIKETLVNQKVVVHGGKDQDVIGLVQNNSTIAICILMVRKGALLGRVLDIKNLIQDDNKTLLENFILEYYSKNKDIPERILLSEQISNKHEYEELLSELGGKRVRIAYLQKGRGHDLITLAIKNAKEELRIRQVDKDKFEKILGKLQTKLHLQNYPNVIECFDITNLMGREAYGSLVCFVNGKPDKSRYRLYKIQSVHTPDDYSMMKEVLSRRFGQIMRKNEIRVTETFAEPDLVLIDGGKGQLNVARSVLDEFGFSNLPVASIAKAKKTDPENNKPDQNDDKIYIVNRKNPVSFKRSSPEFLFLKRVRDEAHRFGIKTHRKSRIRSFFDAK